jgi:DNA-binding NtrC family response regulator
MAAVASPSAATERRPRVLIVDDVEEMVDTLGRYLSAHGFEPVTATEVDGALDVLAQATPAAVVTDLRMRGLDGMDLLETIRVRYTHVPVIIMTAFGTVENAVDAIKRGAFHYLTKPFRMATLRMLLERATSPGAAAQAARSRGGQLHGIVGGMQHEGQPGNDTANPLSPIVSLGLSLHEVEERYIQAVLASVNGNRTRAAQILGVDPSTLYRRGRGGGQRK